LNFPNYNNLRLGYLARPFFLRFWQENACFGAAKENLAKKLFLG
jgi:hypothetical protein